MLQSPVVLALILLTAYYAIVAAVQRARARKSEHAEVGAVLFAGLSAAATAWPALT
jgi:hypothetical protein